MYMGCKCALLLIFYLAATARASKGDTSKKFQLCLGECSESHCNDAGPPLPYYLQKLGWSCVDECKYHCIHERTVERSGLGLPPLKYYGKWPFHRIAGVQEVMATLFSLGNLVPHLSRCIRSPWPTAHYMSSWLHLNALIGVNTWVWAAVFHVRDIRWTERADYFSAILALFYTVWIMVLRLWPHTARSWRFTYILRYAVGLSMCLLYLFHVRRMLAFFDYGYNMKVGLSMAGLNLIGWSAYLIRIRKRHYSLRMSMCLVSLVGSAALEVLDFPPIWGLLDAHAAWHLVTIPLTYAWYHYLREDLMWDMRAAEKQEGEEGVS